MPYLSSPLKEPDITALPRVGAMATMPTRLDSFRLMLPTMLGQVDRLYLFLDGHDRVPDFAVDPKIVPLFPETEGALHCSGRFLAVTREPGECVVAVFDDDILYPPDYVATLVKALVRYNGRAIVGIYAQSFRPPFDSFTQSRVGVSFHAGMAADVRVDVVGTGTCAFLASKVPVDPRRWPDTDCDDLMIALAAEENGVPRVAIARPQNYLRAIAEGQPDSLYLKAKKDETRPTRYMRELIALQNRSPWGPPPRPSARAPGSPGG